MPAIDTNGIRLTYDTIGNPRHEPILLINGLGLQLIDWPEQFCMALADEGFYVIRFDNRDSGLSTKMDDLGMPNLALAFVNSIFPLPFLSGYTLFDMARDTTGLLDALGIARAHIIGASMGGMIAQIIAGTCPHRTLSLTSIMSTSGRPGLPGPTLAAHTALLSRPENPRDFNSVVDHYVRTWRVIGSPRYPTPEAVLRKRVAASIRRNVCPSGTARQLMAVASSGGQAALLRTVRAPTLVIHGSDDPLVPVACGHDTAGLVPNAILHEIEGMGHDFPPALEAIMAELIAAHCKGRLMPESRIA